AIPPEKPAGLTKGILLGLGGVLGVFAGAATAYFLEANNRRVRSVEDAQYLFDLKVLGVIPMSERSRNLLFYDGGQAYHIPEVAVRDKPGSPTCEAYRLLQSNLKTNGTRRTKVLVVVSSIPQEGTSTVCANLAAAIAQSGRRVLLVDANLHNSVQGEIWYIPHMEGLSNILAEEVSFWTAVHNVSTNLDVLPAGNAEVLPSALLDSPQMELVIDHCASLYDAVILDTPALTVSADATLLANLADSGILVVRPELLDIENAIAAQGILEQWGDKMIGMVVNGAPMGQFTYSYDTPALKDSTYAPAVATIPVVPLATSSEPDLPWLPLDAATEEAMTVRSPENLTLTDLEKMSASELKGLVETLSQDWLRSTRLIQEQEAELDLQSQTVSELQERLSAAGAYHRHAANEYDRLSLEVQLADGEERKRLLDQTLMGQRRRLREQHDLLKKSLQMMREKLMVPSSTDSIGVEPSPDFNHPEV
ncbi:MAG TPA: polysaccharide biosynthesis tyrosine autokinase, partial [Stenomitos sp.]